LANKLKVPRESVKLVGKMFYTEPTQASLRKAAAIGDIMHLKDSDWDAINAILEVMCTE
jgi:hypothetical protein